MSKRRVVDYRAQGINNHPYFASEPVLETSVGGHYSYNLAANDYDGDALTFSLEEGPGGDDPSRGTCSRGRRARRRRGNSYVTVKVSDGKGGEDTQQFTIVTGSAVYAPTFVTTEITGTGSERAPGDSRRRPPGRQQSDRSGETACDRPRQLEPGARSISC